MSLLSLAYLALSFACVARADHSGHDHMAYAGHDMGSGSGSNSGSDSMAGQAMQGMPACVKDPEPKSCQSYEYPEDMARDNIQTLCNAMPFMVACGLHDACEAGELPDSQYCQPFVVLATACTDKGMSGMSGCEAYNRMCADGTRVDQCSRLPPVPSMLQTTETQDMIITSCSDHSMPGCEQCTSAGAGCPNTLRAAATVCHAHHMDHCAMFHEMCDAAGDGLEVFCSPDSELAQYDPPMRMYFHGGIRDIVLFRRLVPENGGQYAGVFLAVVLTGIIATALRLTRNVWEALERMRQSKVVREIPDVVAQQSLFKLPRAAVAPHLARTALSFVVIALDYALMLVAMTFNAGLFFAVVIGLALGMLLFWPLSQRYLQRAQARELQSARKCECGNTANMAAKHLDGMKEAPEASGACGNGAMCCDTHTALDLSDAAAPAQEPTPSCCK